MVQMLRRWARNLPTLILSFALALAVWITAVTQEDPNLNQLYPQPVQVEVVSLDPSLVLTSMSPRQVSVRINAPQSIWNRLYSETGLITAVVDLSGLGTGTHRVPVKVQPAAGVRPIEIVSTTPQNISVTLENLASHSFAIHMDITGNPAVGFQAGNASLSSTTADISGPQSLVESVKEVRASLNLAQANENIDRSVTLQPLDANLQVVNGVTVNPSEVTVQVPITQRYGYRNVAVKVVVQGQVALGYRLTYISVTPVAVTVFSADPTIVDGLPGYVETQPVDLAGVKTDIEAQVQLNLPSGVSVVGNQPVLVQIGVTPIESNLTMSSLPVKVTSLAPNLAAQVSPPNVDVILSGALPILDTLTPADVSVIVDLTGKEVGTYQVTPTVKLKNQDLVVVSVQPSTVEVQVIVAPTPTPTPRPTPKP